jgi:hypothetical protein
MKQQPLMRDELPPGKRALLAQVTAHPGWAVVEELFMDACKRATDDVMKVDQVEDERAERKIPLLQLRARERNEFSLLVLQSIQWHIQAAQVQTDEQNAKPPQNPIFETGNPSKDNKQ